MDMRIIFEDDLAQAILQAELAYIDCSLDHELPQRPSQNFRPPSPSPAQFPSAKIVRSTLEEATFNPTQSNAKNPRKRNAITSAEEASAVKDDADSFVAPLVSIYMISLSSMFE